MSPDLDFSKLSHAQKDTLILTLLARLDEAHKRIAELRARIDDLTRPSKTPDNSSTPPSKGHKPNRPDRPTHDGPRKGSLGRKGGGRALTAEPDEVVLAKPSRCRHCRHAFTEAEHRLDARYDKFELPRVRPTVTRVERYAGECSCCGATTLAPVPEGLEPGTPFSLNIVALAMYLRFVHAVSYQRLTRLLMELFGLAISEGALDAAFQRCKPQFDADVAGILARLRRARVVYSDETGVRIDGSGYWNSERRGGDPCRSPQPRCGRRGRGACHASPGAVGLRSLRCTAGPCRSVAGLPRPPIARLPIRHRRWRRRVRPAHEGAATARRSAGAATPRPCRQHPPRISPPS